MAYHIELRGVPLSSRRSTFHPYVVEGSVSTEHAVGERPIGSMSVRVPEGATFFDDPRLVTTRARGARRLLVTRVGGHVRLLETRTGDGSGLPQDFDEVTIDYPVRPYRAAAERDPGLAAYWRLDEAAVTHAADEHGDARLAFGGGDRLQYRAYRSESAAVPYGAAPEWTHTAGAGLTGILPADVGAAWSVAGFLRVSSDAADQWVWRAGSDGRALRARVVAGTLSLLLQVGGRTLTRSGLALDAWHHVAAMLRDGRTAELWVDGVRASSVETTSTAPLAGQPWTMAQAIGGARAGLALDEWGVWSEAIDVAALHARRTAVRLLGGYIYGIVDRTDLGPRDQHVLDLSLVGYGFRLDHSYVRHVYATPTGETVRAIVQDVLVRAGLANAFTSHGVELEDRVTRAVYPVESVMNILRALAGNHGAIVVIDEWREIDMVRRTNVEESDLRLVGGRGGNVATIGRTTEPRFYASRAVVVGRGEAATVEMTVMTDGVTRRYDAPQPIGELLGVTLDGVEEPFGRDARWLADTDQQRFELAAGQFPAASGRTLRFSYISSPALVVTADNRTAIDDVGFPIARRFEDDAIDAVGVARVVAQARLDRHDQRHVEYVATTVRGAVTRVRPGIAATFAFPRYGLASARLLVSKASSRLQPHGEHPVVWTLHATEQDYEGSAGDDIRRITEGYRPPAPRPGAPADPNAIIIDPTNVAVPARLPLRLSEGIVFATSDEWVVPEGANRIRVSGHEIAHPLVMQFMGRLTPTPRTALVGGQVVELRLWDATTNQAVGSAVRVTTTAVDRYVLRAVVLALRDFDLTFQLRKTPSLRGGRLWGVALDLDI